MFMKHGIATDGDPPHNTFCTVQQCNAYKFYCSYSKTAVFTRMLVWFVEWYVDICSYAATVRNTQHGGVFTVLPQIYAHPYNERVICVNRGRASETGRDLIPGLFVCSGGIWCWKGLGRKWFPCTIYTLCFVSVLNGACDLHTNQTFWLLHENVLYMQSTLYDS